MKKVCIFLIGVLLPLIAVNLLFYFHEIEITGKNVHILSTVYEVLDRIQDKVQYSKVDYDDELKKEVSKSLETLSNESISYRLIKVTDKATEKLEANTNKTKFDHSINFITGEHTWYFEFNIEPDVPMRIITLLISNVILFFLLYIAFRHYLENRHLRKETHTDSLTNIPNRRSFMESLQEKMVECKDTDKTFALCFMDLDKFKSINDNYGHEAGDYILRTIATRLESIIPFTKNLARLGGDEFVWIITDDITKCDCELEIQRIAKEILKPVFYQNRKLDFGVSIGISFYYKDCSEAKLLMNADTAMYLAKKKRIPYYFYE